MMTNLLARLSGAALILAFAVAPVTALADSTFYGEAIHVSTNNIKVHDPHTGQTLSFEILPHFDRIFSGDGKTTYQMKDVHEGHYVAIVYDQHFLGARHADKIYVMNDANQRVANP